MQRSQLKQRYCPMCKKTTKYERHVTAMGCGDLFMVVFTLGLWLPLRWLFTPGFRCTVCGSR